MQEATFKKKSFAEKNDIKEILSKIKKRDFSGNIGLVIKNSIYQFSTVLVSKIGSLVFIIILARLLMPELFGLYNLALSTILIFSAFSDFGVGSTLIKFVSSSLGKNKKRQAKTYLFYLGKIKILLIFISILVLLLTSKFIADVYYQKPIFLALIAGAFYIITLEVMTFLGLIFQSSNFFKGVLQKEILFQTLRLILIPFMVLLSLKYFISNEKMIFYIILILSVSYLFTVLFMAFISVKKIDFIKEKKIKLGSKQKSMINRFLLMTASLVLSGMFFSYIDKIMLGRFVAAEFIGYYAASLGFITSLSSLIGFGVVLLPIFSQIKGKRLERGLKKSIRITSILGVLLFLVTLGLAPFIILIIYGQAYVPSINILRLFSLLLIVMPLIGIYSVYFMSKNQPQVVTKLLILSTIINIILNYILITSLIKYGNLAAVFGAGVATLISQALYLFGLSISKRNKK